MQTSKTGEGGMNGALAKRSAVLFFNFFLIILAYYQVKSASRSLLIEYWGSGNLPYVWIASALTLGIFIGVYNRLVVRYRRPAVVLGSLLLFMVTLVGFRGLFETGSTAVAVSFYIFVDIFSVILVEQFWSLADTVTEREGGRKTYWFVGTGGLLGGAVGSLFAARLLESAVLSTLDLLLTCAGFLALTFILNLVMVRRGLFTEKPRQDSAPIAPGSWTRLLRHRYLILIAAALLCAQLAQPVVEYQFMNTIESTYTDLDRRTEFISAFFGILGLVSIAVNLTLTPLIHRYLGIFAGMFLQPLALALSSTAYLVMPTLMVASAMKIADRGLSYSINRASKEQLYIPLEPGLTYQAKAWIDMLGYRVFKVLGAALILALTQWLPLGIGVPDLVWLTLAICLSWWVVIVALAREYHGLGAEAVPMRA